MIEASCRCGAVRLAVDAAPAELTDGNCCIPARVSSRGETDTYQWDDRSITFHRCKTCGCVSHWSAVDATVDRMGVNARLMPPESLALARVRRLDGAGAETYVDD